jgi:hypothetical protein
MKCELCSSGKREPKQRLCLPCLEAMSRLWKIVSAAEPSAGQTVTEPAAVRTKSAPITALTPKVGSL